MTSSRVIAKSKTGFLFYVPVLLALLIAVPAFAQEKNGLKDSVSESPLISSQDASGATLAEPAPAPAPIQDLHKEAGAVAQAEPKRDWKADIGEDVFLRELSRLADLVDNQRKSAFVLENQVKALSERLENMQTKLDAQSQEIARLNAEKQVIAPQISDPDPSERARLGRDKVKPKLEDSDIEKSSKLHEDFEEFLDLGEAMMRRFFGVVKEFRDDFQESRV